MYQTNHQCFSTSTTGGRQYHLKSTSPLSAVVKSFYHIVIFHKLSLLPCSVAATITASVNDVPLPPPCIDWSNPNTYEHFWTPHYLYHRGTFLPHHFRPLRHLQNPVTAKNQNRHRLQKYPHLTRLLSLFVRSSLLTPAPLPHLTACCSWLLEILTNVPLRFIISFLCYHGLSSGSEKIVTFMMCVIATLMQSFSVNSYCNTFIFYASELYLFCLQTSGVPPITTEVVNA